MIVVVTGASQGIGRAVAEGFAGEPDAQVALWARSTDKLRAVAEGCREKGAEAAVFPCDVTDDEAVRRAGARLTEQWGAPDVVVNNAGLFEPAPIADISEEAFRRQVAVNLTSAFVVTKAFLEDMVERGSGHLFYMASIAAEKAYPGGAAYAAAKSGLLGLARTVREETKEAGVRVTTLLPGATRTSSWDGTDLPDERFMPPADVAQTLLDAYRLSGRTVLEEVTLRPQKGDI